LWVNNAYLQDGTIGCESDVGDMYLAFEQGLCKFSKVDTQFVGFRFNSLMKDEVQCLSGYFTINHYHSNTHHSAMLGHKFLAPS
jgi:hypothetical protein